MVYVLAFLTFSVVVGALIGWAIAIRQLRAGEPLVAYEPRRLAPWGLADVFFAWVAVLFLQAVALSAATRIMGLEFFVELTDVPSKLQPIFVWFLTVPSLVAMALSVAVIRSRVGASWLDMGFDVRRIGKDVYLGCAAFVMMAPIVFGLQALVTTYFQQTKHPLIEIAREGRDPWFLLAAGSAAVIIAPVTEEWVFRVVLQGWLQKLFANLPSPREEVEWAAVDKPQLESGPDRTGFAAIVVSSVLFSAIHLNHGGDFVALFVLALGLGYLYYRTNRILPSIVVHMLLNGSTFIMLAAQVFGWLPDVEAAP